MINQSPQVSLIKNRLNYIDKATGFAILCVVYGHIKFPETIHINWYYYSSKYVYKFHMELFMCISGYLAFLSTSKIKISNTKEYLQFQKKKVAKFLPAYLLFATIGILFDIVYKKVENKEIFELIIDFFYRPSMTSSAYLWYIYILFMFYLLTPLLFKLNGKSIYVVIILGIILNHFDFISMLNGDLFCKYFIFFYCGGLIFKNATAYFVFLNRFGFIILISTLLLIMIDLLNNWIIPYQFLCIGIIHSVFYIANFQWPKILSEIFIKMGKGSFAIYLLNTSILYVLYFINKLVFKFNIDVVFIFLSLILTIPISLFIRKCFNKIVPGNIYTL